MCLKRVENYFQIEIQKKCPFPNSTTVLFPPRLLSHSPLYSDLNEILCNCISNRTNIFELLNENSVYSQTRSSIRTATLGWTRSKYRKNIIEFLKNHAQLNSLTRKQLVCEEKCVY